MGILDNFAKLVADQIAKAAPTATPYSQTEIQQASGQIPQSFGTSVGLDRNPLGGNVPFSAGVPIIPGAINRVREDGRPDPRRYEYQVAQNINITETRLVPFKTLRAAADQIDILRRCIEVTKAKITSLDWDIVLAPSATERVMAETGEKTYTRAQELAKEKFNDDINRLKTFWYVPDVSNGLIFADWLNMFLEDNLVLDAVAVWPQASVGGDLKGLQVLDGSTIKPLIDDRGMRPQAPFPAFQQILYGFPRSEFSAAEETEEADGEFSCDELSYLVKNRRTTTVYGYSPTERALPLADLYLRRQQWLRAEYTDGVMPEMFFETDANFGNNPDLLRAYENIFNDDLAGQTEQRKRARLLPNGLHPVQMDGYGERFKNDIDMFLIESICGHFGVMPTEIGYAPKSGLGGAGHQSGQAQTSEVLATLPLTEWVGAMLSQLSYVYLGMPRELEFKFMPSKRNDNEAAARARDIDTKNGQLAINEARSAAGLPLLSSPYADRPMIVTTSGNYFVTDEGLEPFPTSAVVDPDALTEPTLPTNNPEVSPAGQELPDTTANETPSSEPDAPNENTTDEDTLDEADNGLASKAVRDEVKAFIRWLKKSPKRDFDFQHLPTVFGDTLNKFVAVDDYDGARWYAERYLA
jgi:hypothetical protein